MNKIEPTTLVFLKSIVNDNRNKILLIKNLDEKWELPGGILREYKSLKYSIEREVFEKTRLVVESFEDNYYCTTEYKHLSNNTEVHMATESRYIAGEVILSDDHTEFLWVDVDVALSYDLTDVSKEVIAKFYKDIEQLKKLDEPKAKPVRLVTRAVIKKQNKILMLKRAPSNTRPNTWELPGGKLNMLESIEQSIIREIFEETGFVVEITNPAMYLNSTISDRGRHKGYTYINLVSEARISSGRIKITNKHSDYKWVTVSEMFKLELTDYMKIQLTEIFLKKS